MATPVKYLPLPITCDCSGSSVQEAARQVGPSFIYTLTVAPELTLCTKDMLKKLGADSMENPLSPYVGLRVDAELKPYEWFLTANGKAVGSKGVQ